MVVNALFLLALAVSLAVLGTVVRHDHPRPDVEPAFARRVADGVLVLRSLGRESARHTESLVDELSGRPRWARSRPTTH